MPAKNSGKILVAVLLTLLAIGGIVAGYFLIQRQQDLRSQAAVEGGQATVSITPETGSYNVGDTIQTSVFFNTDGIAISGISVRLVYPFSGTDPELDVSSIDVNSSFLSSPDWNCSNISSSEQGSEVLIDISCSNISASGYSTSTDTLLAQIGFNVVRAPQTNPIEITFDNTLSRITQKTTNQDILAIPENSAIYTITGGTTATTSTPTPTTVTTTITTTQTPTPTRTTTGTVTPTRTTTATPTAAELPDAGVSTPTLIGLAAGFLLLLMALVLAL